jgi:hypothetical protein
MYLGIEYHSGLIYAGSNAPEIALPPGSSITQATLIAGPEDWARLPRDSRATGMEWVFLEDFFDPVTRVRRGRLYEPISGRAQPSPCNVIASHEDLLRAGRTLAGMISRELFAYAACGSLLSRPRQGQGATLALGTQRASSAWRVLQTEIVVGGAVLVTLRALTAFGILPDIDWEKIEPRFRSDVDAAYGRALESAFREAPTSVVDQCRNAITVVLSRWLVQQGQDPKIIGKDLADVAKAAGTLPHEKHCAQRLGEIVARLHNRGKENVRAAKELRNIVDEDAELALQGLGFVLREISWAKG